MNLYLLLNLGSLSIPLIYSFHPRIQFYKKWRSILIALAITTMVYTIWDILFTKAGVWGFNNKYILGPHFLHLPLEEWMFFICIPFASVFTHYALMSVNDKFQLNKSTTKTINWIFVTILITLIVFNTDKAYTFVNALMTLSILGFVLAFRPTILQKFYLTFVVVLIPFFMVNGILTGSFIKDEVVWYNNEENLGLRILTIPLEDIIYAFGLILLNILLIEVVSKKPKERLTATTVNP